MCKSLCLITTLILSCLMFHTIVQESPVSNYRIWEVCQPKGTDAQYEQAALLGHPGCIILEDTILSSTCPFAHTGNQTYIVNKWVNDTDITDNPDGLSKLYNNHWYSDSGTGTIWWPTADGMQVFNRITCEFDDYISDQGQLPFKSFRSIGGKVLRDTLLSSIVLESLLLLAVIIALSFDEEGEMFYVINICGVLLSIINLGIFAHAFATCSPVGKTDTVHNIYLTSLRIDRLLAVNLIINAVYALLVVCGTATLTILKLMLTRTWKITCHREQDLDSGVVVLVNAVAAMLVVAVVAILVVAVVATLVVNQVS